MAFTNQNLNEIKQLSIADALIFKFYLCSPTLQGIDIGSGFHQKLFFDSFKHEKDLQASIANIKRQTFRSKALKMADMAAAYSASGMQKKANATINYASVRDANVVARGTSTILENSYGPTNATFPHISSHFTDTEYKVNQFNVMTGEEVRHVVHVFEIFAACREEDLKMRWVNDKELQVQYKYSEAMNFPRTFMPIFSRGGIPTFGPQSAIHQGFEKNVASKRSEGDGYVWDYISIKYSEAQDPDTVTFGDNLSGFDLKSVPTQCLDGTIVQQNLLIICTRSAKTAKQDYVKATSSSTNGIPLNSNWMAQVGANNLPAQAASGIFQAPVSSQPVGFAGQAAGNGNNPINFAPSSFNPFNQQAQSHPNPFSQHSQTNSYQHSQTNPYQQPNPYQPNHSQQLHPTNTQSSSFAPVNKPAPPTPSPVPPQAPAVFVAPVVKPAATSPTGSTGKAPLPIPVPPVVPNQVDQRTLSEFNSLKAQLNMLQSMLESQAREKESLQGAAEQKLAEKDQELRFLESQANMAVEQRNQQLQQAAQANVAVEQRNQQLQQAAQANVDYRARSEQIIAEVDASRAVNYKRTTQKRYR